MPDDYNLPRGTIESSRLDAQHEAYVKIIGYILHPRIASALPADARIAEVGTGTGVWMQELQRTCPSTWTFHGFDISDAQFAQNGTQSRTKYDVLNITEPIPEHLQGQFDVVHLRLLVCGLVDEQWAPAARNVLQLLKPGGWIQWHESQFREMQALPNVPGAPVDHSQHLIRLIMPALARQRKVLDNVPKLRDTVQAAGFEGCEEDVFTTDQAVEVREQLMDVQFGAMQALLRGVAAKDPSFPLTSQELEEELGTAKEELEDGKAYFLWTMRVVTGRRPA